MHTFSGFSSFLYAPLILKSVATSNFGRSEFARCSLPSAQLQSSYFLAIFGHSGQPKLLASAQLNPKLKPPW